VSGGGDTHSTTGGRAIARVPPCAVPQPQPGGVRFSGARLPGTPSAEASGGTGPFCDWLFCLSAAPVLWQVGVTRARARTRRGGARIVVGPYGAGTWSLSAGRRKPAGGRRITRATGRGAAGGRALWVRPARGRVEVATTRRAARPRWPSARGLRGLSPASRATYGSTGASRGGSRPPAARRGRPAAGPARSAGRRPRR